MRGARYVGLMAVLMAALVLGAIPATAVETNEGGNDERPATGIILPIAVKRGLYAGQIYDAEGTVHGKLAGVYVVYRMSDGSVKGRFHGRWTYDRMYGVVNGYIDDGSFKGRWHQTIPTALRERYRYAAQDAAGNGAHEADRPSADVAPRLHYGVTYGRYGNVNGTVHFRGVWCDLVAGTRGYVRGRTVESLHRKGTFSGVWVKTDQVNDTEIGGRLYGIYVKKLGPGAGRFVGRWTLGDEPAGYLTGRFRDGTFKGVWALANGRMGGYLMGTYGNGTFTGRWYYRDGTPGGYLKGRYHALRTDGPNGISIGGMSPATADAAP